MNSPRNDITDRPELVDERLPRDSLLDAIEAAAEDLSDARTFFEQQVRIAYKFGGISLRDIASRTDFKHTTIANIVSREGKKPATEQRRAGLNELLQANAEERKRLEAERAHLDEVRRRLAAENRELEAERARTAEMWQLVETHRQQAREVIKAVAAAEVEHDLGVAEG